VSRFITGNITQKINGGRFSENDVSLVTQPSEEFDCTVNLQLVTPEVLNNVTFSKQSLFPNGKSVATGPINESEYRL
jgi:hypothetical protein